MTGRHSEHSRLLARSATQASFSTDGVSPANTLPRKTFAKNSARMARVAVRYPAATAATGASTSQVVSDERSTAPRTSARHRVSHCEVTEWHRTVTWGMRNGNTSHPQRSGGYDDRRH